MQLDNPPEYLTSYSDKPSLDILCGYETSGNEGLNRHTTLHWPHVCKLAISCSLSNIDQLPSK